MGSQTISRASSTGVVRVVAAGQADPGTEGSDVAVARFLSDGSPDLSFGQAGLVRTDLTLVRGCVIRPSRPLG